MLHTDYPGQVCSVARALEVVGERWSLLLVRDAMNGVARFDEFQGSLGIARNVLATRLYHLVAEGVFERQPYGAGRGRYEYRLTDKGRELGVAVVALMKWGDRHYATADGPPKLTAHTGCGGDVRPVLACETHGSALGTDGLQLLPGPGASAGRLAPPPVERLTRS
jgi:DNA-binding HxlR family transcriptional regulator